MADFLRPYVRSAGEVRRYIRKGLASMGVIP